MQGAGFYNSVTDTDALAYIWNAAIRPVLTHICPKHVCPI